MQRPSSAAESATALTVRLTGVRHREIAVLTGPPDQEGKTFSRHLRYHLTPSATGTLLRVEDDVSFKGLGKLASPIASRDIKKRWQTSLEKLKATTAADGSPGA